MTSWKDETGSAPEYITDHMDALRAALIKGRGDRCEMCGKKSKATLHVHHRHYRTFLNEKPRDVVLLCKKCHKNLHARAAGKRLTKKDAPFVDPLWEGWLTEQAQKRTPGQTLKHFARCKLVFKKPPK